MNTFPNTKLIPLTQGYFAIVDEVDYDWLIERKWYYGHKGYAVHRKYLGTINGKLKLKAIYMHRLILNTPEEMFTDHINCNRLDNRRCNLRICSRNQNMMNSIKKMDGCSPYKGVTLNCGKWSAGITINSKHISLGRFFTQKEAAQAYDKAAIKYFGEFARLNFPLEAYNTMEE